MNSTYSQVYELALTLSPEERQRLVDALAGSPSGLSAGSILETLAAHADSLRAMGVRRIGLFGSHVRGEARLNSDIDVLVEMTPDHASLVDVLRVEVYLEKVFGRKVDVGTADSLRPGVKEQVLAEVIYAEGL